jgi:hypothetical protein
VEGNTTIREESGVDRKTYGFKFFLYVRLKKEFITSEHQMCASVSIHILLGEKFSCQVQHLKKY